MGALVHVLVARHGDCSNGGISTHSMLCVVNVPGAFDPHPTTRAAWLLDDPPWMPGKGYPVIVPAVDVDGEWQPELRRDGHAGPHNGGNAATGSGEFYDTLRRRGFGPIVPIFDRFETWDDYERLSR